MFLFPSNSAFFSSFGSLLMFVLPSIVLPHPVNSPYCSRAASEITDPNMVSTSVLLRNSSSTAACGFLVTMQLFDPFAAGNTLQITVK
ncbi:hypothetical protein FKM82_004897 [Ascaphus truei]